jgi:hypothetical protein
MIHDNWIHYGVIIGAILGVIFLFVYLLKPHDYTMQVKNIQWEYTVHIEEYQVRHYTDESSYPSDAYNVQSYRKRKSRIVTKNGKSHTEIYYVTRYDYDRNEWHETRRVPTQGYDHEPYFGEFTLKTSSREDGIGTEREAYRSQVYTAIGQLIYSDDTDLKYIEISYEIWNNLKVGDELNYRQREIGKPYDISIAQ